MKKLLSVLATIVVLAATAEEFQHPSMATWERPQPVVYTAYSKRNFFARMWISAFVANRGYLPLNPFMVFDFGLMGRIDISSARTGNNTMIHKADEVWVFGEISDGVFAEILLAQKLGKRVSFFKLAPAKGASSVIEIDPADTLCFEDGLERFADQIQQTPST